jgi:hypothetical protein
MNILKKKGIRVLIVVGIVQFLGLMWQTSPFFCSILFLKTLLRN